MVGSAADVDLRAIIDPFAQVGIRKCILIRNRYDEADHSHCGICPASQHESPVLSHLYSTSSGVVHGGQLLQRK